MRIPVLSFWLATLIGVSAADDPFAQHVRTTDPLTPEQQLKSFHLPEGLKIQLVAAEPDLRKPLNMAFDVSGRLWVTESREYPFAAPTNSRPRDTIRIFSDIDESGRARGVSTFATNLNIPIGLYPFRSPSSDPTDSRSTWKCVVWSIPNILLLEDSDHNGAADRSKVLYGPFDYTRDTHGNQASFRRAPDGWIYATHGFNNQSKVSGTDGHEIELSSGNTYRFRLDGSRIEKWTHGQVNPFGLYFDARGNLYSADCHSSPIYQLLRGAYYPSFGKPHDGLGFGPTTIQHSHGSTAIAGIVMLEDPAWGQEFQRDLLIGNVMTSRINRDRLEWRGSSSVGHEEDDFLKCDDPWFRPVDLQLGPDGLLYIADFYNRIIGHYEVPLDHPGRDRERGRIWRVLPPGAPYLDSALPLNPAGLVAELNSVNSTRRSLALNDLAENHCLDGKRVDHGTARGWIGSMWLQHRAGVLESETLISMIESGALHAGEWAARAAAEHENWSDELVRKMKSALKHDYAMLQRCAAEALGQHPEYPAIRELAELLENAPAEDTHLRHVIRIALRNQLAGAGDEGFKTAASLEAPARRAIGEICVAVPSANAAKFILNHGMRADSSEELRRAQFRHIAEHIDREHLDQFAMVMRERNESLDRQVDVFRYFLDGLSARGETGDRIGGTIADWGRELTQQLLAKEELDRSVWGNTPRPRRSRQANPWAIQERRCRDGKTSRLISSHPHGERLTGRLRSKSFKLPGKLSFYLCGHRGFPDKEAHTYNRVRIRLADSNRILHEAFPPRHDTAEKIEWDLSGFAGRDGYFEAIDGDSDSAYAWLAFGRFEPALDELKLQNPKALAERTLIGARLAKDLQLAIREPIHRLVSDPHTDFNVRAEAASALARMNQGGLRWMLARVVGTPEVRDGLREEAGEELVADEDAAEFIVRAMSRTTAAQQLELARILAGSAVGSKQLIQLIESGKTSRAVLTDSTVSKKLIAVSAVNAELITSLTRGLPPANAGRDDLIGKRIAQFRSVKPDRENGAVLFETACAACHQLKGKGKVVGPQLDGIGNRGLDRIVEDILDPNRNVDVAFRSESIALKSGDVISALVRKNHPRTLLIANTAGQEQVIPKNEITSRTSSSSSLMPDNFHQAIPERGFHDLIAFLLNQR